MFDLDDPALAPAPAPFRPAADAYEGLPPLEEEEVAIAFLAAASLCCCCSLNISTSLLFSACTLSISAFSRASFSLSLFVFPNQSVNAAASGPTNSTGFPPIPPRRCSRSRVISSMVRWSFLLVFRAMSLLGRCSATIRSRADAYIFPGLEGLAPVGFENGPKEGGEARVEWLVSPVIRIREPESNWNRNLPPGLFEDRLLLLALLPTDLGRAPVSCSRSKGLASARFSSRDRVDRSRA